MGCCELGKGAGCQSVAVRRKPVGVSAGVSENVTIHILRSDTAASFSSASLTVIPRRVSVLV